MNKDITNKLDEITKSIELIKQDLNNNTVTSSKENEITCYGSYSNTTGTSSNFKMEVDLEDIIKLDNEEITNILQALGNKERFSILKLLLANGATVNEIVEELNFQTTGKAYHHLNILIMSGIVHKKDKYYRIDARYIGGLLIILTGIYSYIKDGKFK